MSPRVFTIGSEVVSEGMERNGKSEDCSMEEARWGKAIAFSQEVLGINNFSYPQNSSVLTKTENKNASCDMVALGLVRRV